MKTKINAGIVFETYEGIVYVAGVTSLRAKKTNSFVLLRDFWRDYFCDYIYSDDKSIRLDVSLENFNLFKSMLKNDGFDCNNVQSLYLVFRSKKEKESFVNFLNS